MRILIVEDNPVSAKMCEALLHRNGYETLIATTGTEALDQLRREPAIDLVITDIMMPEMNGLDLIRAMKADPAWSGIPVIVASALGNLETVMEASALGCQGYILKPIKAEQLRSKVREALVQEEPVLRDPAQVMAELGVDQEAYREIARRIAEQVGQLIGQIEASSSGLAPELLKPIQDVLESATLLGAERLKQTGDRLDWKRRQKPGATSPADAQELLKQLKALQAALGQLP
jgi:CheY-like chemotaxis protein